MMALPVTHPGTGVTYPSRAALARAFNVTRSAVCLAIRNGRLDRLGSGGDAGLASAHAARRQPVASLGHHWPSQTACARALGMASATVSEALDRGTLDRLVARRIGPARDGGCHGA
jgi:hypothetical protein